MSDDTELTESEPPRHLLLMTRTTDNLHTLTYVGMTLCTNEERYRVTQPIHQVMPEWHTLDTNRVTCVSCQAVLVKMTVKCI